MAESDDIAEVAASGVVEVAAAGDQAERGVRDRPVDGLHGERRLAVQPHLRDLEDRQPSVRPQHERSVARTQPA